MAARCARYERRRLPRKLVITTKTDEARPQHAVVYTWNLAPSFNEGAFTFESCLGAGSTVRLSLPLARQLSA